MSANNPCYARHFTLGWSSLVRTSKLVFLVLSLGLLTGPSHAGIPSCDRVFTLALHAHGLLYSAETDSGIDKDIADEMIKRSGCKVVVSLLPRARIWQLIESGALDFSLSGITNADRDKFADFAWYFSNKYYLLTRKDANVSVLADFSGQEKLQLGVIRSFRYSPNANQLVDQMQAANRLKLAGGLSPLYQLLIANQIQGMIIEPFDYPAMEEKRIREISSIVEFKDPPVLHGLIMSKRALSPNERSNWRSLIAAMIADGSVRRIFQKYFTPELAATMVDFQVSP
jgi:polar amino acid transport system substrate-binding protein